MRDSHAQSSRSGFLPAWLAVGLGLALCVPMGHTQERSTIAAPAAPPPQVSTPAPSGIPAQVVNNLKVSSAPVEVHGPFRERTRYVPSGKTLTEAQDRSRLPSTPPAAAGIVRQTAAIQPPATGIARQTAALAPSPTLAPAGRSAIEAAAAQPHPGDPVTARAGVIGESLMAVETFRSQPLTTFWPGGNSATTMKPDGTLASVDGGQDPQIAVSDTTVAILTWSALAFYDKSGKQLPQTNSFVNPTNMSTLFADALVPLNASLNLNPVIATLTQCGPPGACVPFFQANGDVGDARIVFDAIHKRWVVVATAKNDPPAPQNPGDPTFSKQLIRTQRRTKFLLAVSRDEDPAKGFNTYFFNASPDDGACNSLLEVQCPNSWFTPGNASDYPSVGVSDKHYMLTVHADHGQDSWGYLVTVNAQDVMNGISNPHAHAFWGWDAGGGDSASFVTMPVVNQDIIVPLDKGMIIDTHNDKISITTVSNDDPPVLNSVYWDIPKQQGPSDWAQKGSFVRIDTGNVGTKPITATEINNTVVAAFNDCRKWTDSQNECSPSIHLFSADSGVLPFGGNAHIDRVVGWGSVLDDPPNDVVSYGLPGIAMNRDNDIAVVYIRNSPLLFAEVRYSTWLHGELDVRPSRLLRQGDGPMPKNIGDCICILAGNCPKGQCVDPHPDTAGVAVDPFDRTAIWMAHVFANSDGGLSTAVGKVFGKTHPDLTVPKLDFSPAKLHPGDVINIQYTVYNGGDGMATKPTGHARLVPLATMAANKIPLGDDTTLPDLAPGTSVNQLFAPHLPANVLPGHYMVEVEVSIIRTADMSEYSINNNTAVSSTSLEVAP